MKKLLLTTLVLATVTGAFAQGTVLFNNRVAGSLVTQVFLPEANNQQKTGNTAANTPAGTQIYAGAPLTGNGWTASLWAAPGNVIPAGVATPYGVIDPSLALAAVNATTTFRTGTASGNWAGVTTTLTGVANDASAAVIQVRVYPSSFGSWATAVSEWSAGNPLALIGASPMFVLNQIGGIVNTPPVMAGLQSFSVVGPVPEPSSFALAGMGLASLLIFRRRK